MKVLVTAATKHGATGEIADALAAKLEAEGLTVVKADPDDVEDLDGVEAVVLGSAVYAGQWLSSAKGFVERLGALLVERRVWLFSSGPVGDPPKPAEDPAEVAALIEATRADGHRVFPGKLDRSALSFGERAIVKVVRAADGDFRAWDEIAAWSAEIAAALREEPAEPSQPGQP